MEETEDVIQADDTDYCLSLPYGDRLEHKNWKVRSKALEEFPEKILECKEDESALRELGTFMAKTTSDSNQNVLEAGLDACLHYFTSLPYSLTGDVSNKVIFNVIDKAFGSRPSTQTKGKQIILKIIEMSNDPPSATSQLLAKVGDKRPKIPPMCIDTIIEGIIAFGAAKFPVKDILKALPTYFTSTNAALRDSAMKLLVEIHRWIGIAPLQSLLESMRPSQKTDFEKLVGERSEQDSAPTPTIYLSNEKHLIGQNIAQPTATKIDAREFVDEVDLAKKLKTTDFNTLIVSDKWVEQAQALDIVIDAIGPTPKLKQTPIMTELMKSCHEMLKNGHLQVQLKVLKVVNLIGEGLRQKFAQDVRQLIPTIILKSKEKKLINEVESCSWVLFSLVINPDYLTDDLVEILSNKKNPPHAKQCINQVYEKIFSNSAGSITSENIKKIYDSIVLNSEDSDPKVRETSVKALHFLLKSEKYSTVASDYFKVLKTGNPKLHKKISEVSEAKTEVLTKTMAVSVDRPKESSSLSQTLPTKLPSSKPSIPSKISEESNDAKVATKKSTINRKENTEIELDETVEDGKLTLDDAKAILMELEAISVSELEEKFASAKWQDKVEACTLLGNIETVNSRTLNAVFSFVFSATNNFKISNINVLKAVLEMFAALFPKCQDAKSCKYAALTLTNNISDKWGDKKIQQAIESLCKALFSALGCAPVIRKMNKNVESSKSPTVHQAYLQYIKNVIDLGEFKDIPILAIVQLCIKEMDNKTSAIRTTSIEIMGSLYSKLGPPLLSFMNMKDLNPQVKALLDAEFGKVGYDPSAAKESNFAAGLLPRRDLSELLDKTTLTDLNIVEGKDSWQSRKAAMEKILAACESCGHYLEANKVVVDLLKSLKLRLVDTQSNLKPVAAMCIAHVVASLELDKGVKLMKIYAHPLLEGLIDNKKNMRDSTISALNVAVHMNTPNVEPSIFMCFVSNSTEILLNVIPRQELLAWFLENEKHFSGDCSDLVPSLVSCLQDKIAAVRTSAEQLLTRLVSNLIITKSSIDKGTRDLAPASKRALQPVIERIISIEVSAEKSSGAQNRNENVSIPHTDVTIQSKNTEITKISSPQKSGFATETTTTTSIQPIVEISVKETPDEVVLQAFKEIQWSSCPSADQFNQLKDSWFGVCEGHEIESIFKENSSISVTVEFISKKLESFDFARKYFGFAVYWVWFNIIRYSSQRDSSILIELVSKMISIQLNTPVLCGNSVSLITSFFVKFDRYEESTKIALRNIILDSMTKLSVNECFMKLCCDLNLYSGNGQVFAMYILVDIVKKFGFGAISRSSLLQMWRFISKESISFETNLRSDPVKQFLSLMMKFVDNDVKTLERILEQDSASRLDDILAKFGITSASSEDNRSDATILNRSVSRLYICMDSLSRKANDDIMEVELIEHVNRLLSIKFPKQFVDKVFIKKCAAFVCYGLTAISHRVLVLALLSKVISQTDIVKSLSAIELMETLFDFVQLLSSREQGLVSIYSPITFVMNDIVFGADPTLLLNGIIYFHKKYTSDNVQRGLVNRLFVFVSDRLIRTEGAYSFLSLMIPIIDDYCTSCIQDLPSDFIRTTKFVINEARNKLNSDQKHQIVKSLTVGPRSFLWHLIIKLFDAENVPADSTFYEEIVSIINEITVSNDKVATIRKLYDFQRNNPQINVRVHLQQLSSAFRKFVSDTLNKFEESDSRAISQSDLSDMKENNRETAQNVGSTSEAFRILESLKAKPSPFKTYEVDTGVPPSPAKGPLASPFTRRNEKIRDSLSNLSRSLDLPTITGPLSENESLEERLQRLKSMK